MGAVKQKRFKANGFCVKPMTPPLTWSDPIEVNGIPLLLTLKLSLRYFDMFGRHFPLNPSCLQDEKVSCEPNSVDRVQRSI